MYYCLLYNTETSSNKVSVSMNKVLLAKTDSNKKQTYQNFAETVI